MSKNNNLELEQLKQEYAKLKSVIDKGGLIWKDYPEENESKDYTITLNKDFSFLTGETSDNKIIEGDNLLALRELQKTYKDKIDVIYIDPPYNTGNEFAYSDSRRSKEGYSHSKWLSFMAKRLKLAQRLLSDEGVIFVSIDDNEQAQLKLLMDSIFGEQNFVSNFIWLFSKNTVKNGKLQFISSNLGQFRNTREHILVYTKDISNLKLGRVMNQENEYILSRITNKGNHKSRLLLKKGTKSEMPELIITNRFIGGESERIEIIKGDFIVTNGELQNDVLIEGEFRNPNIVRDLMDGKKVTDNRGQEFVEVFITRTGVPYTKKIKSGESFPNTLSGYGSSSSEYNKLKDILNTNTFDYPKPTKLIKDILKIGGILNNKNATVLDFFAGSGTTGHAVLELNKEDDGNRKFILCTNNEVSEEKVRQHFVDKGLLDKNNKTAFRKFYKENKELVEEFYQSEEYEQLGIARSVTRERIKKVSVGYTTPKGVEVKGLDGDFEYYIIE